MNQFILDNVKRLIEPLVEQCGYDLYYMEFVKEDGENYLRVYIDNIERPIILDDCVKVNKLVSDMLDEKDPIQESYYLEISSPGVERALHTDAHLNRYIGAKVNVKLREPHKGKKKIECVLKGFDKENISLEFKNELLSVNRRNIITISLKGEY
ncbi:ribosome maturation factor RimP [Hathewaya proteolytica DSM 3090]|uniref:Ribosome maturation factor RimP n=1 Tax=Hathewaya proteolytica DSM 3090 TaxID=1121331 RepID=A0A1M6J5Z8_9CLOT|nr:ribosome maturation factor RimP [Hathewaya proteolytica]SHJ42118.1 ribosome maturation factor RimP [Hathewaya proteolytica DSM 3090]